jgi:hypothetical protein
MKKISNKKLNNKKKRVAHRKNREPLPRKTHHLHHTMAVATHLAIGNQ